MKPQDSTEGATGSSKTKNIDLESASLNDLLERLEELNREEIEEKIIAKREEGAVSNTEILKGIVTKLESDIADGSWMHGNYADMDLKWMPKLIEQANKKYPEMQLNFATTPEEVVASVKKMVNEGISSSRLITNVGGEAIHFSVIDQRNVNGETSLVLLDTTTFNNQYAAISALKIKTAIEASQLPHCYFSMAEMDIQRSPSECGILSLALAKKLYRESNKLQRLHEDNVRGVLCNRDVPVSCEQLDEYLPSTFFKHVQSSKRLREYMKANPKDFHKPVNKKGEDLCERRAKNLVLKEEKDSSVRALSVSAHKKRVTEYKSLMR
ncbi:YopJ/AvrA family T3SS effector serine/threonine acetyltransferase [Bartonella sp. B10]